MLHKSKPKFSIITQIELTIYPTQIVNHESEIVEREVVTPEKRKKGKKNKKTNKVENH